MSIRLRLLLTVLTISAYMFFMSLWRSFIPPLKAQLSIAQVNGDSCESGFALWLVRHNMDGWFLGATVLMVMAMWLPLLYNRVQAHRGDATDA